MTTTHSPVFLNALIPTLEYSVMHTIKQTEQKTLRHAFQAPLPKNHFVVWGVFFFNATREGSYGFLVLSGAIIQ